MSVDKVLGILIQERDRLNRAIEALQGSARTPAKRRKLRTAAQRKAQSEKMKKYWAMRRKQQAAAKQA
jgi:hypothetical protein